MKIDIRTFSGWPTHQFFIVQASGRQVSKEEGAALARKHGCLFVETSAKANVAVNQAFEELVQQILETPSLLSGAHVAGVKIGDSASRQGMTSSCCS